MKNIYLIITLATLSACRKNPPEVTETSTRYNCVCETKITYIDHCGRDSSLSASAIYGTKKSAADKECTDKNNTVSNSYSVSIRKCELQ